MKARKKEIKRIEAWLLCIFVLFTSMNLPTMVKEAKAETPDAGTIDYQERYKEWLDVDAEEYIDLGLSVDWCNMNYGASKVTDKGEYFLVGDTDPSFATDENSHFARSLAGGDVGMPTQSEVQELINQCNWEWTENYEGSGVSGYKVSSKKSGYEGRYIFLPATGYFDGETEHADGNIYFWAKEKYRNLVGKLYAFRAIANNAQNLVIQQTASAYSLTIRTVRATRTGDRAGFRYGTNTYRKEIGPYDYVSSNTVPMATNQMISEKGFYTMPDLVSKKTTLMWDVDGKYRNFIDYNDYSDSGKEGAIKHYSVDMGNDETKELFRKYIISESSRFLQNLTMNDFCTAIGIRYPNDDQKESSQSTYGPPEKKGYIFWQVRFILKNAALEARKKAKNELIENGVDEDDTELYALFKNTTKEERAQIISDNSVDEIDSLLKTRIVEKYKKILNGVNDDDDNDDNGSKVEDLRYADKIITSADAKDSCYDFGQSYSQIYYSVYRLCEVRDTTAEDESWVNSYKKLTGAPKGDYEAEQEPYLKYIHSGKTYVYKRVVKNRLGCVEYEFDRLNVKINSCIGYDYKKGDSDTATIEIPYSPLPQIVTAYQIERDTGDKITFQDVDGEPYIYRGAKRLKTFCTEPFSSVLSGPGYVNYDSSIEVPYKTSSIFEDASYVNGSSDVTTPDECYFTDAYTVKISDLYGDFKFTYTDTDSKKQTVTFHEGENIIQKSGHDYYLTDVTLDFFGQKFSYALPEYFTPFNTPYLTLENVKYTDGKAEKLDTAWLNNIHFNAYKKMGELSMDKNQDYYDENLTITFSYNSANPYEKIYYTTDGTKPNISNATVYNPASGPLTLDGPCRLRAVAIFNDEISEELRSNEIDVTFRRASEPTWDTATSGKLVNKPSISIDSGAVTITADENADIYYTLDGSAVNLDSANHYTESFALDKSSIVKAIASINGVTSDVTTSVYVAQDSTLSSIDDSDFGYVDLGLSVKWANRNVGASSMTDVGGYYQYGGTSEKESYALASFAMPSFERRAGKEYLSKASDAAYQSDNAGRMPTTEELQELVDSCTWTYVDGDSAEGSRGYLVTGTNGNSIFLPAGGYKNDKKTYQSGDLYYWSSDKYGASYGVDALIGTKGQNQSADVSIALGGGYPVAGATIRGVTQSDSKNPFATKYASASYVNQYKLGVKELFRDGYDMTYSIYNYVATKTYEDAKAMTDEDLFLCELDSKNCLVYKKSKTLPYEGDGIVLNSTTPQIVTVTVTKDGESKTYSTTTLGDGGAYGYVKVANYNGSSELNIPSTATKLDLDFAMLGNMSSLTKVSIPCSVKELTITGTYTGTISVVDRSYAHNYLKLSTYASQTDTTGKNHDFSGEATKCNVCGICKEYATNGKHAFVKSTTDATKHICSVCKEVMQHDFLLKQADGTYKNNTTDEECACGVKNIAYSGIKVIVTNPVYDGTDDLKTPTVAVKLGDTNLEKDTDYIMTLNPVSASVAGETDYEIVITGMGNYFGTRNEGWNIDKSAPTKQEFTLTTATDLTYDKTAKAATVEVKSGVKGMGTISKTYYKLDKEGATLTETAPKNAGNYKVYVDVAEGQNYSATTAPLEVGSFIIEAATPVKGTDYTIPAEGTITADCGQLLSEVSAGTGFVWTSADEVLSADASQASSVITKVAKFVMAEKTNYKEVENIEISITVTHKTETKQITGQDKHHDVCTNTACSYAISEEDCQGGTATCATKAKCDDCGQDYGSVDANKHVFNTYVADNDATCTTLGHETATCENGCGQKDIREIENSYLTHNYVDGVCSCGAIDPDYTPTSSAPPASNSQAPSNAPSAVTSQTPSTVPSTVPSSVVSETPSTVPSSAASETPSANPGSAASEAPSTVPSSAASETPSAKPGSATSQTPSTVPSSATSEAPSTVPSSAASETPSANPGSAASEAPSIVPSSATSQTPSTVPSSVASETPSAKPSSAASETPSANPSSAASQTPSSAPSKTPSSAPSTEPSKAPAKGDELKDEKSGVKIEILNPDKKEAAYTAVSDKDKKNKTIKVKDKIVVNGVTYKVTTIDSKAFKGNKTVTKVTLPKTIKVIGKNAFSGCKNLKTLSLPKNVTEIGANAFKGCGLLTKMTIPSKVETLGANAFGSCKNLKKITIKTTKLTEKNVGKNAFKGLSKDTVIKVPKKCLESYKKLFKKKGFKGTVKA